MSNQLQLNADLNELASLQNVSVNAEATVEGGVRAKDILCKGWPAAKGTLEAATFIIKNPVAKVIIKVVIQLGDALLEKFCEQK